MFFSSWRRIAGRPLPAPLPARRRRRDVSIRCEQLEPRCQPTAFAFTTGIPDGKVATISEPASAHNSDVEFESADDFALTQEAVIRHATFTGLLTGGATPADVSNVVVEIYRVFPKDSDVSRTSGPPTFSHLPQVPTRVNSPSDVAFESRDSADKELNFDTNVLAASFTAHASVSSADQIRLHSGGNGEVTGVEVEFDITFRNHPLDLPPDHYFFVPQVGLADSAPAGAHFLWLSAPRPIVPPGTAFPPGVTDLQSWMRDDPPLAPDWLRIGTDIVGAAPPPTAPTFNAAFSVSGEIVKRQNDDAAPAVAQINFSIQAAPLLNVPPVTNVTETGAGIGLSNPPTFPSADTAAALAPSGHRQDGTPADVSAVTSDGTSMRTARDDDGSVGAPLLFPDGGQG
jgi:hypothetical protein